MVWAHVKLDTNNPDEIVPYLQSTINESPEEFLGKNNSFSYSQISSNTPKVLHEHSKSLFEDNQREEHDEFETPTFGDKLDGINEVDPYGARLVSLLARIRNPSPSIRVSTLITQLEDPAE